MNTKFSPKFKLLSKRQSWGYLAFLSLILAINNSATAGIGTWAGGNGNWSVGGNWNGGVAPSPLDSLVFTNLSGAARTATNDFTAGTAFNGITFNASSAGSTLTLAGNDLLISGMASSTNAVGIINNSGLTETVSNNLALDWGYYKFISPAGSLSLKGSLTPSTGSVINFGTNGAGVASATLTNDGTGLIGGIDGAGLIVNSTGFFTGLATMSGGVVSPYGYGAAADQSLVAAAQINSLVTNNVKLTPSGAVVTYTLPAGNVYVNTILNASATTNAVINPAAGQTLVLGPSGGIYITENGGNSTTLKNLITIGGAGSLSAGGNTPGPGRLTFGVGGGNNTGNQIAVQNTGGIVDNPAGGAVSVDVWGTGSMYMQATNTYTGGTYVSQGSYLQGNNLGNSPTVMTPFGTGPVYIGNGATVWPYHNGKTTLLGITLPNDLYLSPGLGFVPASGYGSVRCGGVSFSGKITLQGPSANGVVGAGDRFWCGYAAPTYGDTVFSGQITGSGTLELFAGAATTDYFWLSNTTANANNWTGGLILDGNGRISNLKMGADNQLVSNNVTINQSGTTSLDLNGHTDSINTITATGNASHSVDNTSANPASLTIGAANGTFTFAGVVKNTGGGALSLTKAGSGTATLTAANSYSGNTTVLGGLLVLSGANPYGGNTVILGGSLVLSGLGSIASTPQISISNGSLDVSAVGAFATACSIGMTNSSLNLGPVQAPNIGNLAISNSTLTFLANLSQPSIIASGTFTTGGSTNVLNLTSVPGSPTYPAQVTLIKYGSADPGLVDGGNKLVNLGVQFPLLGAPVGYLTNNVANGSIDLVLLSGPAAVVPISWNGKQAGVNNGNWDIYITTNWITTAGSAPYLYQQTSVVNFDDSLTGTTNVNLTTTLLPASINVNNNSANYVFSGTGKINGTTGLTKDGSGTLTLAHTGGDAFTGGLTNNNGTLIIDNNSSSIGGGTRINGGVVQVGNNDANGVLPAGNLYVDSPGSLVFNRTDTALAVSSIISGAGAIVKNNTGTVTLNVYENGFFGPVTVNAGTLAFGGPNISASGIAFSTGLVINTNATAMTSSDNGLSGNGPAQVPITINAGGVLTGLASANGGLGTSSHIGLVTFNGGTLAMAGTQAQPAFGTWDLDGGITVNATPFTSTISASNVIPTQIGGTIFNVDSGTTPSGVDLKVSGTLIFGTSKADTGIVKNGAGTMLLANNNTYKAGTTVNGGVLILGTSTDAGVLTALGSGPLVNLNSAVVKFNGSKGITVPGAISDDGTGVFLFNSGTNTLAGTNTYTSATTVAGGTLALSGSGSLDSSVLIAVSNATFDISATTIPFANPNTLALTNSALVLSNNLITGLSRLAISNATLTFPLNTSRPNIMVTNGLGTLATGGTTNIINITAVAVPGLLVYPTNITLIQYTAGDNLVVAGNQLTTLGVKLPAAGSPVGYLTNNVVKGSIDLVLLSGPLYVSTNAFLNSLVVSPVGNLSPAFATNVFSYTTTNAYGSTPTLTVVNADLTATNRLIFNATTNLLASGVASSALTLNPNPGVTNTIKMQVTAQDGVTVQTYTVNLTQLPSQTPPLMTNSVSSGVLTLNWPVANQGYRLQVQTNSLNQGLGTNWSTWPSSTVTNKIIMTINQTNPSVFLRLVYP